MIWRSRSIREASNENSTLPSVGISPKGAIWIVFGNRRLKALKVKMYLSPRDYKQCNGPVAFEQYYSTTCEGKESTGPARWCLGDSHRPTRLRWTLRAHLGQHDRSRTPPKGACRNTRGTCGRWAVGMSISVRMSTVCLSNWDRFSGLECLQRIDSGLFKIQDHLR